MIFVVPQHFFSLFHDYLILSFSSDYQLHCNDKVLLLKSYTHYVAIIIDIFIKQISVRIVYRF
jgi:hypothetical protein